MGSGVRVPPDTLFNYTKVNKMFFNKEAQEDFITSRAKIINSTILASSTVNKESRLVRRIFGVNINPKSIVDYFKNPIEKDELNFGVNEEGYYYFDDNKNSYVGPYKDNESALQNAEKHLKNDSIRT